MSQIDLFVIDTNILISAFILPRSTARKVIDKARNEGYIVGSEQSLNEFSNTFVRPKFDKYVPLEERLEIIDDFSSLVYYIEPLMEINICRDPKDDKFLELACSANAKCIVTGDQDLLVLNPFRGIPIITVLEFLNS
jgi:putative PIN family toxin of toxin-antitoxin system